MSVIFPGAADGSPDLRPSGVLGKVQDFLGWPSSNLDFGHPPKEPACCAPARTTLRVEYDHGEPAEMCVSAAVAHCEEELLLHIAGERQIRGELPPGRITGVKR